MSRVLLFGAGGIGSIYVYILQKAGASVTAVCRSNYEEVKQSGFTINSKKFGQDINVRPAVVRTPAEAEGEWDYIVICSKAMPGAKPSIPEIIKPAVGPRTTIVLVQNGIRIEEEYTEMFPDNPVLSCVVYLPVTQTAPGQISMGDLERLEVGTYPSDAPAPHSQAAKAFIELLRKGGSDAELYEDVQLLRWKKLIINAVWNPICALSRCSDVHFMQASPGATGLIRKAMLEVVAIAQALGYTQLTEKDVDWQLDRAKARIPDKGIFPSMVADAFAGRRMEVEAIVGNAVKYAKEKGVGVPHLEMVYCLIKALDKSFAQ